MRRALACACLAALAPGQDVPAGGAEHAFVELTTSRDDVFVQERFTVRLVVCYDREFFRTNAVQLFRQPLDVPVQLLAPWLANPAGAIALPGPAAPGGSELTVALDDGVGRAAPAGERTLDGRVFDVLEIARDFLPTSAGELTIPAPALRYAFATRFDDDFLHGRVAADRRDALAAGKPLTITVRALPEEGRPLDFGGAVGRFTVAAEVAPREVEVGGSIGLALRVEGSGNLQYFDAPRPAELEGFHIRGTIDDRGATRRTITYDLAPEGVAVREVPALAFSYFDPGPPAGYRTLHTQAIAIRVRAPAPPEPGPAAPRPEASPSSGPGTTLLISVGVVLALAAGVLVHLRRRARLRPARDPGHARAHAASAAFRARAAEPDANLADAFADYLAACAGIPASALKVHGLPQLLEGAGVRPELARRAAALLEAQLAARYGGGPPAGGAEVVRELVDALDASFTAADEGRAPRSG